MLTVLPLLPSQLLVPGNGTGNLFTQLRSSTPVDHMASFVLINPTVSRSCTRCVPGIKAGLQLYSQTALPRLARTFPSPLEVLAFNTVRMLKII